MKLWTNLVEFSEREELDFLIRDIVAEDWNEVIQVNDDHRNGRRGDRGNKFQPIEIYAEWKMF